MARLADSAWIVEQAKSHGFDLCGVVRADKFPELQNTPDWLDRGYAGEMRYLSDPRRSDPRTAMPQIRSVIVCALNYNTAHALSTEVVPLNDGVLEEKEDRQKRLSYRDTERMEEKRTGKNACPTYGGEPRGWISRYAWGDDYHDVLKPRLDALVGRLKEQFPQPFEARTYVDTGPVQERVLAKYAGLGWLGKNTLLLNQRLGSFFFLGVILTTLDLEQTLGADELPPPDLCGRCTRCLDACPTQAFVEPYVMDARKCISYLTIELRDVIPKEFRETMGNHVFGCDICQDVCPWNRRARISTIPQFQPRVFPPRNRDAAKPPSESGADALFLPRLEWLLRLSEDDFRELFRGSAVKRTKWRGLMRNACIAAGNSGIQAGTDAHQRIREALAKLAVCGDSVLVESAQWALSRIQ